MSALQKQVFQKVSNLSEENLRFLLEMIDRYMKTEMPKNDDIVRRRIGIAKGQDLYDDDYDLDELNPEIAEMFGAAE